ncbi:MAG: sulfite exporter TauE/SafE family protein [Planctomycetes bacterium]|nr:sulfite exporter TauE/SafE family protein [Planctomycetota bacterium]
MDSLALGSLFALGFLGSGHCVGMCGPIVLALPRGAHPLLGQLAYHCGRIVTYTAIGAVIGAVGMGLGALGDEAALRGVRRMQVAISLLVAAALIWFGLTRLGVLREPPFLGGPSLDRVPVVGRTVGRLLRARSLLALFALGLLLGFLPCGLSFAAFTRALPSGDPLHGALLVAAFGLGTLPALLLVATAGAGVFRRHRKLSELLAGVVMLAMGVSLAVDGVLAQL